MRLEEEEAEDGTLLMLMRELSVSVKSTSADRRARARSYVYFLNTPSSSLSETREVATTRVWDEHRRIRGVENGVASSPLRPVRSLTQVDSPGNRRQNEDLILGCCGGDVFAVIAVLNLI